MNHDERHLSDQLRRAAGDMPEARIDVDAIRHSERLDLHRSRQAVLLAVAATIVAIALPVATVVLIQHLQAPTPPVATQSPSASASPSVSSPTTSSSSSPTPVRIPVPTSPVPQRAVEVNVMPSALPTGPPPAVPYIVTGAIVPSHPVTAYIHRANNDGPTIPVRLGVDGFVSDYTTLGGGYLVLLRNVTMGDAEVRYYSATGAMTQLAPPRPIWTARLARGHDGSVAVSLAPGQITLFDSAGNKLQTWQVPNAPSLAPFLILPDHSVLIAAGTGVFAQYFIGQKKHDRILRLEPNGDVVTWSGSGQQLDVPSWPVDVNPANGDLTTSATCLNPARALGVVNPNTQPQQLLWLDCGYGDGFFSPDGALVAASREVGPPTLGIFDAKTGAQLVGFQPTDARYWNVSWEVHWEDDTHVLVLNGNVILRVGLDGTAEQAGASAPPNTYVFLPR